MKGLIGKKIGMTQVFDETGMQVAVTVVELGPCSVVQLKTEENDGYEAAQVSFGTQKEQRLTSPLKGHYKKAKAAPARILKEFFLDEGEELELGQTIDASNFEGVNFVDVTGISKGRGFQGTVKRWNFAGGRASHGGKEALRVPGSIGQCTSPSRVVKGKKMSGHMGSTRITKQNLKVIAVRPEDNAILIKGSISGPNGGYVEVRKALKKA